VTKSYVDPALNFIDSRPSPKTALGIQNSQRAKNNVFHLKLVFKYFSYKPAGKMEISSEYYFFLFLNPEYITSH